MKIALCPTNPVMGDFSGNLERILRQARAAAKAGAELALFPELSLIGYPCQDLLLRPSFAQKAAAQLDDLQKQIQKDKELKNIALVVGTIIQAPDASPKPLLNAAVFLQGERREVRVKRLLPNYDVFSEERYFLSANELTAKEKNNELANDLSPIEYAGKKIGLLICEDSWHEVDFHSVKPHKNSQDPSVAWKKAGADMLLNLSASPYSFAQKERRRNVIATAATKNALPIFYVNQYGAQDELIFDGDAFAYDSSGKLLAASEGFSDSFSLVNLSSPTGKTEKKSKNNDWESLRQALVLGIRDYVKKNGFERVVLGLSGGIDSALVAVLAKEALGAANVLGLLMPSKYSSSHSLEDAEALAQNLGIQHKNIPIKFVHSTLSLNLKEAFREPVGGLTDENLQSRLRGIVVMAFANRNSALALATGNKSEFAVGYSTLYGDMCGALAPIGDLYKTQIYALAKFINEFQEIIPARTISKAPSAELRANQTDQDSLPAYDFLDACLYGLIESEWEVEQVLAELQKKFPRTVLADVQAVAKKLRLAEYKRKQAPPILRVSDRAFGSGRRYPLTAFW